MSIRTVHKLRTYTPHGGLLHADVDVLLIDSDSLVRVLLPEGDDPRDRPAVIVDLDDLETLVSRLRGS